MVRSNHSKLAMNFTWGAELDEGPSNKEGKLSVGEGIDGRDGNFEAAVGCCYSKVNSIFGVRTW